MTEKGSAAEKARSDQDKGDPIPGGPTDPDAPPDPADLDGNDED
jgi:hypothetical protein